MRKVNKRQFLRYPYKEVKQTPFLVTERGKNAYLVLAYTNPEDPVITLNIGKPSDKPAAKGLFAGLFKKKATETPVTDTPTETKTNNEV